MADTLTLAPFAIADAHLQENGVSPGHSGVPSRTAMLMSRSTVCALRPASRLLEERAAHFPQPREEARAHGPLEVPGAERPSCASSGRSDDALDQLHMQESPSRECLLVLEQALGEQEQRRGGGADIEILDRDALALEHPIEELLERR